MARLYLDANVFISFIQEEMDPKLRGLFVEAQNFFIRARLSGHVLVISDLFIIEVKKRAYFDLEQICDEFEKLELSYEIHSSQTRDVPNEIRKRIHFPDSLHVTLALEAKCEYIVTFNIKDFLPAQKWIKVAKPENT